MNQDLKKQKFIELRAEELSLDKISKIIEISKPTLIKWCKELQLEIHNQKSLMIDSLKDEFQQTRRANLLALRTFLTKVEDELSNRDLSTLAGDKLFALYVQLKTELAKELDVTYREKDKEPPLFGFGHTESSWKI